MENNGYNLVVLTLAVTSIAVSQFGTGCYTNSDIAMSIVATFVLLAIPITKLSNREALAYAAVWALLGFHSYEILIKYGSANKICNDLSSYGFTHSVSVGLALFLISFLCIMLLKKKKSKDRKKVKSKLDS